MELRAMSLIKTSITQSPTTQQGKQINVVIQIKQYLLYNSTVALITPVARTRTDDSSTRSDHSTTFIAGIRVLVALLLAYHYLKKKSR